MAKSGTKRNGSADSLGRAWPSVLIVSPHAFSPFDGTGVYLAKLFDGWPSERLSSLYSLSLLEPASDLAASFYKVDGTKTVNVPYNLRRAARYIGGSSETWDAISSFRMTDKLLAWLGSVKPDIVYSHLGPLWMTRLTNQVVDRLGVPLVVHINDDYILDWPVVGRRGRNIFPFAQILNFWNKREFERALNKASVRMVVSDSMRVEYERRYGGRFYVVDKGLDPRTWSIRHDPQSDRHPAGALRVFFGGSLAENTNMEGLRDAQDAIRALVDEGVDVSLDIASPHPPEAAKAQLLDPNVRFIGSVPHSEMPRVLGSYDLLLLPYNFAEGSLRFIRYSWPMKLPECMFSGTPILIYGPSEASFVEYARSERWAHVVSARSVEKLISIMRRLAEDREFRYRHVARAQELVEQRHDIGVIREEFQALLMQGWTPSGDTSD